jgi:hypothetical protein
MDRASTKTAAAAATAATPPDDEDWITATECIDADWLSTLLPRKETCKIDQWLDVLKNNEFETFSDLARLDAAGWASLQLPLAVSAAIRKFIVKWEEDSKATSSAAAAAGLAVHGSALGGEAVARSKINQVDCVVMDISGSMKARSRMDADKTREDVSKILFHSLMDKLVALELSHAVGLLAFGAP